MDQLSERYVEQFIVVSDSLKKTLIQKRGISSQRVIKIYNGIELDQYHPDAECGNLRKQWGIPDHVPLIGAIGRMVWQKGFEYLIEAVPEIMRVVPEAGFLLVGDGPLKDKLKVKSEKLKVADRIIFTGFRGDIKDIIAAIDILVIPSLLEGFPMITLEAMAMGKPIIATRIDGIVEQISDGEEGILVPPGDPDALAKAIIRVLTDTKSGKTMGVAGRKKVEQEFSVEKMVSETEKVYMSLLKGNYSIPQN
jgi:glycosyltransferase involved in cell wall biosynthesis